MFRQYKLRGPRGQRQPSSVPVWHNLPSARFTLGFNERGQGNVPPFIPIGHGMSNMTVNRNSLSRLSNLAWSLVIVIMVLGLHSALFAGRRTDDQAESAAPKYAAWCLPLSREHAYFRANAAPDFWALIPHYTGQKDDRSCSVASVAMVVNALRQQKPLHADDRLITHDLLLSKVQDAAWINGVSREGHGLSLQDLGRVLRLALSAFEVQDYDVIVQDAVPRSAVSKAEFLEQLAQNESSADDLIVINVLQGTLTGDPEGNVGHMAPIAAFDAARNRVLVLDPDRDWYEPYWVSTDLVWEGMSTLDPATNKPRGYLVVRRRK